MKSQTSTVFSTTLHTPLLSNSLYPSNMWVFGAFSKHLGALGPALSWPESSLRPPTWLLTHVAPSGLCSPSLRSLPWRRYLTAQSKPALPPEHFLSYYPVLFSSKYLPWYFHLVVSLLKHKLQKCRDLACLVQHHILAPRREPDTRWLHKYF